MSFSFFLLASPIRVRLFRLVAHQLPPLLRALNVTAGPAGLVIISILSHPRVQPLLAHITRDTYTLLLWCLFTSQLTILPSRPPRFSSKLTCPAPHVKLVADDAQILVQTFGANGPPGIDELSNIHRKNNRLPTAAGATSGGGAIPNVEGAGNNKPAGLGAGAIPPKVAGTVEPAGATIGGAIPPEVAGTVEPAGATIGGAGARGRGKAAAT
jgi:hypothetical protein